MKSDYVVQYGFNNSHMDYAQYFNLYRDAVAFYESLDRQLYQSAVVFKQFYKKTNNPGELGYFAHSKQPKLARFQPGTDNTAWLMAFCNGD